MFKKVKENEYVQKFLEIWHHPRYRSLIILALYIVFFIFVITYIRSLNDMDIPKQQIVDVMTEYKEMDNYQYQAQIKNVDTKILIGKVDKENQIITFNNNIYYVASDRIYTKDEAYTALGEDLLDFDIWRFTPSFISSLIEKGNLNATTEFTDGIKAKNYLIKITDFIKLYFGDDTTDNGETTIGITVYQSDKHVTKVELDLSSMYHMEQFANSSDYKVILEYEFIDKIDPIIIDIEE